MSKRNSNQTTLKEAIDRLLQAYKLKGKMQELDIVSSWEQIMGRTIAKRTKDLYIKDKVLVVKLDSSVLREELQMGKSKIIELINQHAGEEVVNEIILK
ncbi:MAG: DUF721 domain-containing protein [Flavobacteriales bacterium]|nr:DUF721 domain-containing protein [Flavobacteriales bacterium]